MRELLDRIDDVVGSVIFKMVLLGGGFGLASAFWALQRVTATGTTIVVIAVLYLAHLISRIEVLKRQTRQGAAPASPRSPA